MGIQMENKFKWHSVLLFGLGLLLLASSVIACQPTPPPAPVPTPTPSPAPVPTPTPMVPSASLTEATMASEVDSFNAPIKTAGVFTDDISTIYCCAKLSNAPANTQIKAEWIYVGGERPDLLNCILFENSLIKSGSHRLKFSQTRSESGWPLGNYEVVLYLNGEQNKVVPFSIMEAPPPPPEPEIKELLVNWIVAEGSTVDWDVEGSVTNVGTVALHDISIEISTYDSRDATTPDAIKSSPLYPSPIAVSESAHFHFRFHQSREVKYYTYRFVSSSGEVIPFRRED